MCSYLGDSLATAEGLAPAGEGALTLGESPATAGLLRGGCWDLPEGGRPAAGGDTGGRAGAGL